jgi:hypothetical protein
MTQLQDLPQSTPAARAAGPHRPGRPYRSPRPVPPAARPLALGPHARWWQRLDDRTREHLLTDDGVSDLPVDVWGTCMASAHAEGLIEVDGWFDDVTRRRLPFVAAAFVQVVRSAGAHDRR